MSDEISQSTSDTTRWYCLDCGHTTNETTGKTAGRKIKKTIGEYPNIDVTPDVVCPRCYSEEWIADAFEKRPIDADEYSGGEPDR
jgi:transposase-like protein